MIVGRRLVPWNIAKMMRLQGTRAISATSEMVSAARYSRQNMERISYFGFTLTVPKSHTEVAALETRASRGTLVAFYAISECFEFSKHWKRQTAKATKNESRSSGEFSTNELLTSASRIGILRVTSSRTAD